MASIRLCKVARNILIVLGPSRGFRTSLMVLNKLHIINRCEAVLNAEHETWMGLGYVGQDRLLISNAVA